MKEKLSILLSAFALLNCQNATSCSELSVSNAWIREPPPMTKVAAGYFRIKNRSDQVITLTKLDSECCERVEMHETKVSNGRASMSSIPELTIAPHQSFNFSPGGSHLMLIRPAIAMTSGAQIDIELYCANGRVSRAPFEIVAIHSPDKAHSH